MPTTFSSPAILLRRTDYGDYDLIIAFLTRSHGKLTVMGKSAKRSVKRFGGLLGLFSLVQIVWTDGRRAGLPILQEATLDRALPRLGPDVTRTALASYWGEIATQWCEEGKPQLHLYHLLRQALISLDEGRIPPLVLSMAFQVKFLSLAGLSPALSRCHVCGQGVAEIVGERLAFDVRTGRMTCGRCARQPATTLSLTKGTVRQLQWMERVPLSQVARIRCLPQVLREAQTLLETFLPYHLGKKPKSLTFLERIRDHADG
jgi:DNA repair protein RecO (recombination protein O)